MRTSSRMLTKCGSGTEGKCRNQLAAAGSPRLTRLNPFMHLKEDDDGANIPALPIMTTRDVADLYRCSERKVLQMKAEGKLQPMPFPGRLLRFRRSDVLETVGYADPARQPLTGTARPA